MNIIDHPNFYHWLILLSVLLLLSYAALKIKNEPDQYEQTAVSFNFHNFFLRIPSWWGKSIDEAFLLEFQRLDTRYEWTARFQPIFEELKVDPNDFLSALVEDLKIKFDPGFGPEIIELENIKIYRHEGMATENDIKRVYLDIAIAISKDGKVLKAISRSSILNGCVEGPYFEKVLENLKYIS